MHICVLGWTCVFESPAVFSSVRPCRVAETRVHSVSLFGDLLACFPKRLPRSCSPSSSAGRPGVCLLSPALVSLPPVLLQTAPPPADGQLAVVFIRLSLKSNDLEHFFMCGWELLGRIVNAWP